MAYAEITIEGIDEPLDNIAEALDDAMTRLLRSLDSEDYRELLGLLISRHRDAIRASKDME